MAVHVDAAEHLGGGAAQRVAALLGRPKSTPGMPSLLIGSCSRGVMLAGEVDELLLLGQPRADLLLVQPRQHGASAFCAASAVSIISRGLAKSAAVGSEIARISPLRSVIIARRARGPESRSSGESKSCAIGFSGRCGGSGWTMVASASFSTTARNRNAKPRAENTRRERVFSIAARRRRSGAVTRTVSMRGTAASRGAPKRCAGAPGGGASGGGASEEWGSGSSIMRVSRRRRW